ncbi:pectinesterase family protein [Plebeiibacterium marinum]|uniref:Pectinesterase n=1 Tax=Plebeiibacterium marinum TaxID=2992111 RepID=A0AAE3MDR5_9BACT|nr:pectinesterase family protein [Plebeiobacterium marinum]MCW3805576.1 pectinesterase family protein [Plebeiobacterium marinum]
MKLILNKVFGIIMLAFLLSVTVSGQDKVVVAIDGSGDYTTIQEALNHCKAFRDYEQVIFIKDGIYHEKVFIDSFLTNIKLVGESKENTIITYSDHAGMPGIGTFNSYTVKVSGDNIKMVNLTIENGAGEVGQAVALHVEGDLFEIKDCNLLGNQDTLYAAGKNSRQLFTNCFIDGTTDFIFGAAIAVFENCTLHSKRNSYITAASTTKDHKYGYVFKDCKLSAEEGVDKVYLGRPWRDYANVVFIDCEMGAHIVPEGWHNWGQPNREKTSFYAEYNSKGPGANVAKRVKWSHQLTPKQAEQYSINNIFRFEVEMD